MDKIYYIIYKITNKLNGKIYIGAHQTKNIFDDYMGSGKYLLNAIEKFGVENFQKEILYVFDNSFDMYEKESHIVNEEFLSTANTYNIKLGGYGGWNYINDNVELRVAKNKLARKSCDSKLLEIYGVNNPSKLEHVRESSSERLKMLWDSGKMPEPPKFTGKKHKPESIEKMKKSHKNLHRGNKNSQYGTIWITDGVINKKIKKYEIIPEGWFRGRS